MAGNVVEPARDGVSGRQLRLLLVTARYLPFVGGTEVHTAEVARRLVLRGHDVTVLTTDFDITDVRRENRAGLNIWWVPAKPRDRDWYWAPRIAEVIRDNRWQVVHCQGYHTFVAPLAMRAAAATAQPYVVTFHSGGHDSRVRRLARPAQRAALRGLLRGADQLIGVTDYEAEFFTRKLHLAPGTIQVVSNGVGDAFTPRTRADRPGRRLLVSVGRLERYKGHHRLIEALPELHRRDPRIRVAFVGEGPYRAALERALDANGVRHLAEFHAFGPERREEFADFLASSELVVSLSEHESQGMAVLEALALGCNVLVNDATAYRQHGVSGQAHLAPPRCTAHHLADIVMHCLDEQSLGSRVRQLPTWESATDALEAIYQRIAARHEVRGRHRLHDVGGRAG